MEGLLHKLQIPPYVIYAVPGFFILIGLEVLIGKITKRKIYRLNDAVSNLSMGTLSQLWGLSLGIIGVYIYHHIEQKFGFLNIPLDSPTAWVACFVLQDFCYYWFHRMSHEINFLWATHTAHHQSEEYNLIVALRQTGLGKLTGWIFYVPLALLGFPLWMYLATAQINLIYQFWVHTEMIDRLDKFSEFLLSTPSHHRVHHAKNSKYLDSNYGGIFITWDRLFNTFIKEEERPVYGTVEALNSFNPLWGNFQYFFNLLQQSIKAEGSMNKFKVWIKPPGWYPVGRKSERMHTIPEVDRQTFKKYDPTIHSLLKNYVFTWFILSIGIAFYVLVSNSKMPLDIKLINILWVTVSLTSLCRLLENKKFVMYLESFRLLTIPFVCHITYSTNLVMLSTSLLVSFSSFLFLYFSRKKTKISIAPSTEFKF